jgi:hypothetical protein
VQHKNPFYGSLLFNAFPCAIKFRHRRSHVHSNSAWRNSKYFYIHFHPSWKISCWGLKNFPPPVRGSTVGPRHYRLLHPVVCSVDFWPWRWKRYVRRKHWFSYQLQGAISQKMLSFTTTAVRAFPPYWVPTLNCSRQLERGEVVCNRRFKRNGLYRKINF